MNLPFGQNESDMSFPIDRKPIKFAALLALWLILAGSSAFAQASIYGVVSNSDFSTPQPGELNFYGYLDNTDEEIRIESGTGSGFDNGNWYDDFQNYLTEAAGNPYDFHFTNLSNGEGFHLEGLIPVNVFEANIQLAPVTWPAKPNLVSGTSISSNEIRITWDEIPGLTYHIYRRIAPSNGSLFRIDDPTGSLANPGVTGGEYIDDISGVITFGQAVDYMIIAEDSEGNLSPHSDVIEVTHIEIEVPVVTCPADITIACDEETDPANTGSATAVDNTDPSPVLTFDDIVTAGSCPQERVITRTWTATDFDENSSQCIQTITVVDDIGPVLTCPADISVPFGNATDPAATGTATATDNCTTIIDISYSDVVNGNIITRTWTAADECDNISTCDQTITIEGSEPPVITCPTDITVDCSASIDPTNTGIATATDDNDPSPVITYNDEITAGACANESVITRTWTVTDVDNNTDQCVQTITITDNIAPSITCPVDIAVQFGESTDPSNTGTATADDNCSGTVSISFVDAVNGNVITRTWTASDDCGNSTNCNQTITIEGSAGPEITCPGDIAVDCSASIDPANTGTATATDDNDPSPLIEYSDVETAGSCINAKTITRTWTATDSDENSTQCVQIITVTDAVAPTIACPADINVTFGNSTDPAVTGFATATDNCTADNNIDITYSDVADVGIIARTWTATDECGNSNSCDQIITILGSDVPVVTCPPDITVECTASTDPANTGTATATDDNDPNPEITHDDIITDGDCPHEMIISRTWTATDLDGNSSNCTQTITVQDSQEPEITCPADISVPYGNSTEPVATGNATATDNCSANAEIVIGYSDNNSGQTITRTWTATDECGNEVSCDQTITILGSGDPVITCPEDIAIDCSESTDPSNTGVATAVDDIDTEVNITYADIITSGSCEFSYTVTRTWTAEDSDGNTSSCEQTITVSDNIAPEITCPGDITVDCAGSIDPAATGSPVVVDNCDDAVVVTYSDVTDNGIVTRTWTVTDACGNSNSCQQILTIEDTTPPQITVCPDDIVLSCEEDTSAASLGLPQFTDDCDPSPVLTWSDAVAAGTCPNNMTITRTFTVTDNAGNSDDCVQIIDVTDDTAPVIDCPSDITVTFGGAIEPENTGEASASDNCDISPVITYSDIQSDNVISRTWVAVDACDNSSQCIQTITLSAYAGPVWYVSTTGIDGGDGDFSSPFATIQYAVNIANEHDTVMVLPGTYTGSGNKNITTQGKNLVIMSAGGASNTIIDCEGEISGPGYGFSLGSGTDNSTIIEGLTISNGYSNTIGAGIRCNSMASPTIRKCIFRDNVAFNGGAGISLINGSSPAISECEFINNHGDKYGGAIYCGSGSNPTITNCLFTGNSAGSGMTGTGGAILCVSSSPIISFSTFDGNSAQSNGGAIAGQNGPITIENCTFYGNSIYSTSSPVGGILMIDSDVLTINNSIIAFSTNGRAVYCVGSGASVSASCSDIYGNDDGDWSATGCTSGLEGTNGNISLDPMLCDPAGGNFRLSELSPCAPSNNSCGILIGSQPAGCIPTDVGDEEQNLPNQFSLEQNYPNPFNPSTNIGFTLPNRSVITLDIYNISGQKVITAYSGELPAGHHTVVWNGADRFGRIVPTGIYLYRLKAGESVASKKMLLLK